MAARRVLLAALLVTVAAGTGRAAWAQAVAQPSAGRPLIVFLSDFGTLDDAVAICKGVMKTIAPQNEIIDLTHQVTPFSISEGARMLLRTSQYYPAGTVFVTVIDPGVGTSRKAVVVKTRRGQYFVLPDNGLITPIADRDGLEGMREITNPAWVLAGRGSSTFHGRDIFSPAAAHLARGEDWTQVGPLVATPVRLEVARAAVDAHGIEGMVVALDGPYGNLVTNVSAGDFRKLGYSLGDRISVGLGETRVTVPYARTFGAVRQGEPLLYIDSRGLVSLGINQGNFAQTYHITPPTTLSLTAK
ncbi:MAG: S-adenosyl-l-methionine hydroxide adenosyltransferase family protein [Proteobacteria bacterium]|nr:S-adenosyl-l-methionine hydroxide adenosyltransferase family protein [Pseudomonadota bacterium]